MPTLRAKSVKLFCRGCRNSRRYLGHYTPGTATTIELYLYCHRCKGHTRFTSHDGDLIAQSYEPKTENSGQPTEPAESGTVCA